MKDLALEMTHPVPYLIRKFAIDKDAHRFHLEASLRIDEKSGVDFAMFVSVGESRQDAEQKWLPRRGVVPLAALRPHRRLLADVLEVSMGPESLCVEVGEDRELDVSRLGIGGLASEMVYRQLPPKVVERAPDVVDGVSNQESPAFVDLGHPLGDPDNKVGIGIELAPRCQYARRRLSVAGGDDRLSESFDVTVGSIKLRPATRQPSRRQTRRNVLCHRAQHRFRFGRRRREPGPTHRARCRLTGWTPSRLPL